MDNLKESKLERIGRQAMNIQIMEAEFKAANSDGKPVDGTEHIKVFVCNLENISMEEVEQAIKDGSYAGDARILVTDPEHMRNIFPHAGESDKGPDTVYWKPVDADLTKCSCSACGFTADIDDAMKCVHGNFCNGNNRMYTGVKYRFCPHCGAYMSARKGKDNE